MFLLQDVDVLVIGVGQAGLAMGHYLSKRGASYLLIDANPRVGDSWRNRYDSLTLFTPRAYSSLPGLAIQGDPNGCATKDEVADYLEGYAEHFNLAVHTNTEVMRMKQSDGGFTVTTNRGDINARKVVVASGPFQKPFTPQVTGEYSDELYKVHTYDYRNPSELREGPVLVVGAQNSGVQIAAELIDKHEVYLSVGRKMKFLPTKILGKSLFWWFERIGVTKAAIDSKRGQFLSQQDPIIGKEIQPLIAQGHVTLCPRTTAVDGTVVSFADGTSRSVNNIIWATGYRDDYSWIDVTGVFDTAGKIIHQRGRTSVPGLYFIGRVWQYRKGSAMLSGVGQDAEYLASIL